MRKVQAAQIHYWNAIEKFWNKNQNIIYLGETLFDTDDVKEEGFSDGSSNCVSKAPASCGKRLIILHAGGSNGWTKWTPDFRQTYKKM